MLNKHRKNIACLDKQVLVNSNRDRAEKALKKVDLNDKELSEIKSK